MKVISPSYIILLSKLSPMSIIQKQNCEYFNKKKFIHVNLMKYNNIFNFNIEIHHLINQYKINITIIIFFYIIKLTIVLFVNTNTNFNTKSMEISSIDSHKQMRNVMGFDPYIIVMTN